MSKYNKIKVLIVEPSKAPYAAEIYSELECLQEMVGGLIQAIYPYDDPVAIICNDEGKLIGLPYNRPLYDEDGMIYDIIVGTFIVAGLTEDDFGSLTDELIERYLKLFSK